MKMVLTAAIFAIASGLAAVQAPEPGVEHQVVRQAVLDYAEGYYDNAPERMTRVVSPLLTKRALVARPGIPPFLSQMNAEMLLEATRGGGPRPSAADRRLVAEVLDVSGDLASARVFSVLFNDYVHLVKRDGQWQLVSVLWHTPPPPLPTGAEVTAAIERASREYVEAFAGSDRERVLSVLSPVAAIRTLMTAPSGAHLLRDQNAEATAAGVAAGQLRKGNPTSTITVLGVDGDIASVKLGTGLDTTYIHFALQGGKWIAVNTLSEAGRPRK